MTPAFALTLSFDGISLLRRVPGGWASLGDVALDAADLRGALADLRMEADSLSSEGGLVKLVLPNEQIKYLSIPDAGHESDALEAKIKSALDGATPYAVDDLRFDWSQKDSQVFIAAVAHETLDEAEAFAKSHHFDPVSFVANAPDGQFEGEVFFGAATSWSGEDPTRDDAPLTIVAAPVGDIDVDVADIDPSMADLVEDTCVTFDAKVDADETPQTVDANNDETDAMSPGAAADVPDMPAPDRPTLAVPPPPAPPAPSFASIRASREAPANPPSAPEVKPVEPSAATAPKPRLKLGGARKSTKDTDVTASSLPVDTADDAAEKSAFGFFSRRKSKTPKPEPVEEVAPPVASAPIVPPAPPKHDPEPARAAVARIAAMRAGRDPDAVPAGGATTAPDERQRMTIFGARTEPQIGGKPRFLGLMLTSALLLVLLAVAAWASVFLDEGLSRFFDPDDEAPSLALPDIDLQPLDGSITSPPPADTGVEVASLEPDTAAVSTDGGLSIALPPPAAMTPEEAEARYAATGIWLRSPDAPRAPEMSSLDDLYIASIDASVEQFDAVALPSADLLRKDETYLSQPNPPAPGSRYNLNDRGLVIATPEGAVTPEGVRVFVGPPPVVPPARPLGATVPPTTEEVETTEVATAALQAFRPRPRPSDLIEGNERAQLSGWTRAELAAFRPNPRPETLKAVEEEAQPEATEFAVAQSVEPVTRPRNFAGIVERARTLREQQTTQQVTQVAAVAPRTVQPRIPSSASVARQATVTNAINLRRINLIGVYGKPSNRRALVRLSNGRYQKVEVGDRLDGGRVAAIGIGELRYTKNGRNHVLDMPDG